MIAAPGLDGDDACCSTQCRSEEREEGVSQLRISEVLSESGNGVQAHFHFILEDISFGWNFFILQDEQASASCLASGDGFARFRPTW